MAQCGRKPVLDEGKRREILAILSVGGSQATAARYVGCAPSTIHYAAEHDADFAKRLCRAICNDEVGLLRNIRKAAELPQYWRAAAWALERGYPAMYAPRGPDVITVEQIALLLSQVSEIVSRQVPEQHQKEIAKSIERLAISLGCAPKRRGSHASQ